MLSLSQLPPVVYPTLKATLSAYHIILPPAPDTGGLPGSEMPPEAGAENNTLLSVTCRRALGVVVPIPTFCALAQKILMIVVTTTVLNFFIIFFYGDIAFVPSCYAFIVFF